MKFRNKYFILRHGEAVSNVNNIVSCWPETFKNPLTKVGREMIKEVAIKLAGKRIDFIFASSLLRTRQSAEMVAKSLKLEVKFDKRLREISFGILNGKPAAQWDHYFNNEERAIYNSAPGGETYSQVLERVWEFMREIDEKYKGKTILIVSHQCPLWLLENKVKGLPVPLGIKKDPQEKRIGKGELRQLN